MNAAKLLARSLTCITRSKHHSHIHYTIKMKVTATTAAVLLDHPHQRRWYGGLLALDLGSGPDNGHGGKAADR